MQALADRDKATLERLDDDRRRAVLGLQQREERQTVYIDELKGRVTRLDERNRAGEVSQMHITTCDW